MSRDRATPPPRLLTAEIPAGLLPSRGTVVSSAVSPCGKRLAMVVAAPDGLRCSLEIVELASRKSTVLETKIVIREGKIAWSPDGKTLALTRFGIDLISVATGDTTRIFGLELGPLDSPSFSADGSRVTVSGAKGFATIECASGKVHVSLWDQLNGPQGYGVVAGLLLSSGDRPD